MQKFAVFFFIIGLIIFAYLFFFEEKEKQDFDKSKKLIVMRKIAHDILLYAKDSTSRILPAKQISQNDFIIPFESQFSFLPDSLVNIINTIIIKNHLSNSYIVNVFEKESNEVIFGYSMVADKKENIIPCGSRLQASSQYRIHIKFQSKQSILGNALYFMSILFVFFGALIMLLKVKINHFTNIETSFVLEPKNISAHSSVSIGKYIFYPNEQKLEFEEEQITLTAKETKLLSIFSTQMNQIVDREKLQKEVWEDEGVFVGRSLDMFISKLRKRLEKDEHIKLINIHGKGYKLINDSNIATAILRN
ncbi:MAG: winged helix family transcriptional regulator [Cytophagales bacterium]|nr:MAG: winged helix family transcriptional regulator [Cytophagales bacterium]TAH28736.1 MAG: winged helix family transcriptional regulator [Cytophagales bacterium]